MTKKIILPILLILFLTSATFASVSLIMLNHNAQSGTQVTIPVKVKDFVDIISVQGTVQFDPAVVSYVSVQGFGLPGMNSSNFGTTQTSSGKLTFLWMDGTLAGVTLADSTTIFTITFNVIGTAGQSSLLSFVNAPTPVEIVNVSTTTETAVLVNGAINVVNTTGISASFPDGQISQNFPNPFNTSTSIMFNMPDAGEASIVISDITGKVVWAEKRYFEPGNHVIVWNGNSNTGNALMGGTYFCRITSDRFSSIIKMSLYR